jgi:hypothetical protein
MMNINTRTYIKQNFPDVSFAAIKNIDDEWMIIGKFCQVTPMKPGVWDLYICNNKNFNGGLGQRKVNNIARELQKHLLNRTLTICDGEAFVTLYGTEVISQNLKLLGIRRKRQVDPKVMEKLRKHRKQKTKKHSLAVGLPKGDISQITRKLSNG